MTDVSRFEARIRELVAGADLETLTAKQVRKQLEAEFEVSLAQQKVEVDRLILDILQDIVKQVSPSICIALKNPLRSHQRILH